VRFASDARAAPAGAHRPRGRDRRRRRCTSAGRRDRPSSHERATCDGCRRGRPGL